MAKCEKCKNYEKEIQGCLYMDADCKNDEMFKPFTNYDRIRNMSIDEMAEFLMDWAMRFALGKAPLNVKVWLESEIE